VTSTGIGKVIFGAGTQLKVQISEYSAQHICTNKMVFGRGTQVVVTASKSYYDLTSNTKFVVSQYRQVESFKEITKHANKSRINY